MIELDDYNKLKSKIDNLREEANKSRWKLHDTMKQLKEEFGCRTVKSATTKLEQLEEETEGLESEFRNAFQQFEEKWASQLDEHEDEKGNQTRARPHRSRPGKGKRKKRKV